MPDIEDEALTAAARDGILSPEVTRQLVAELLRSRRDARIDSRRAGAVKKLKWMVEALLAKVEQLDKNVSPEDVAASEPPWLRDAARALGEVGPDGQPLALNWTQVLRRIESQRRKLEAFVAIAKFSRHLETCDIRRLGSGMCSCGYSDALGQAIAAGDRPPATATPGAGKAGHQ